MEKIKKIALISLIWLLTLFFISVIQIRPIPTLFMTASFFQIPIIYWIVLMISPFLLYIIAKDSKNPLIPLLCTIVYFFLFYSVGLYFMSHPTISDIESTSIFHEILTSITHIDVAEFDSSKFVSAAQYFQWPVFFIFSKIFYSVLGTGSILTFNLGFFSLMLILPVFLPFFYKRTKKFENATVYFILPALYLTLGWHFINDQYVPQFLALIYLFILFVCYLKYVNGKNPIFLVMTVVFYALTVFTHSFIFIFFLIAILFEMFWSEYVENARSNTISYGLMAIFFAVLFPYYNVFYSMVQATVGGESWRVILYVLPQGGGTGGAPVSGPSRQILYNLVPQIYNTISTNFTKVAIGIAFVIVTFGFLYFAFKKKGILNLQRRSLFDINILVGSAAWFVLGLAQLVLGQRALQVAALPLAGYFHFDHKFFSHISKIVVVIILIAPAIFIANDLINSSLEGDRLMQDFEENVAGRFADKHFITGSSVLVSHNPYPTGFPSGFRSPGVSTSIIQWFERGSLDFYLDSPKLQKRLMYFNIKIPKDPANSVVYDNNDIKLVSLSFQG